MVNGDGNETQCTVHTVTEKRDASVGCRRAVRYGVREIVERANRQHATGILLAYSSESGCRATSTPAIATPCLVDRTKADRDGARDTRTLMRCE